MNCLEPEGLVVEDLLPTKDPGFRRQFVKSLETPFTKLKGLRATETHFTSIVDDVSL